VILAGGIVVLGVENFIVVTYKKKYCAFDGEILYSIFEEKFLVWYYSVAFICCQYR
jgi:hypothetical protein